MVHFSNELMIVVSFDDLFVYALSPTWLFGPVTLNTKNGSGNLRGVRNFVVAYVHFGIAKLVWLRFSFT